MFEAITLLGDYAGKPTPVVTWFVNGKEVAGQLEETGRTIVVNKLTVPQLRREHLNTTYKCRASNTNLMAPLEKTILLDVHCKFFLLLLFILLNPSTTLFPSALSRPSRVPLFYSPNSLTRRLYFGISHHIGNKVAFEKFCSF